MIAYLQFYPKFRLLQIFLIPEQLMAYRPVFRKSMRRNRDSERRRPVSVQGRRFSACVIIQYADSSLIRRIHYGNNGSRACWPP